mgnify:CR=1 FL=1
MKQRVVITGMGICAPNGTDLPSFTKAMFEGLSGIRKIQSLQDLGFRCQVAGEPPISETTLNAYFTPLEQKGLNCTGLVYGTIAGVQAWEDAGLAVGKEREPDWEAGVVFGTSILGVAKFREAIHRVDAGWAVLPYPRPWQAASALFWAENWVVAIRSVPIPLHAVREPRRS